MAQSIVIEDIKDGDILAEPVLNNYGQTLIPSGATLKQSHVNLLRTWNILSITIKSDQNEGDDGFEFSEEVKAMATEQMIRRMKWKPRNPNEEDLFQLGVFSAAKKIIKG